MTLGEKIQALRKQSGMSQEQLAERITISRQAISRWELNESIPDTDNIVQLSRIFGVSTDYLLKEGDFIDLTQNHHTQNHHEDSGDRRTYPEKIAAITKRPWHRGKGPLARIAMFCMVASPAIFLVLGLFWGLWHPGWLVFVLPGMVLAAASAADL